MDRLHTGQRLSICHSGGLEIDGGVEGNGVG